MNLEPCGRRKRAGASGFLILALMAVFSLCISSSAREGNGSSVSLSSSRTGRLSTTYYVRLDGGSPYQCTGLADAPYPGSGTSQPCAWDHPFRALPPGGPALIDGGDTLIIGSGSYRMGYGAPGGFDPEVCHPDYPWACHMTAIPGGPDEENPTRILGEGWDAGCPDPPELWGAERADRVLDLTDASHVEVACLEITDHSDCVEFHSGDLTCERHTFPYGPWAATGLYAEDSTNVHLRDLDIHGLASAGIHAGRLTDWTVEDVRIAGNGFVGWDGDLWEGGDSNSGTLHFRRFTVEWNGCGETYPGGEPTGCWAQTAGGYGDGLGTGATQGHWIIEDSAFLHNTSDGLDLLYAQPGAFIEIHRTIAEGNAGQQIKTRGPTHIENSILVGNCGYFQGRPFTFHVDPCRALGSALVLYLGRGDQVTVTNSTLTGEGDCLVAAECGGIVGCDGSELIELRNNIFQGHPDFLQPYENTCLIYEETFPADPFDLDYSVIADVKGDPCPGPHDICGVPPCLADPSVDSFDAHLLPTSPAIDAGTTEGAPTDDFDGLARDDHPDIGAREFLESCIDGDGDGYGDPPGPGCPHPEPDCDDDDPDVNPGAKERMGNRIDDDCDGFVDEPCCGDLATYGYTDCPWPASDLALSIEPILVLPPFIEETELPDP